MKKANGCVWIVPLNKKKRSIYKQKHFNEITLAAQVWTARIETKQANIISFAMQICKFKLTIIII